jgi:ABC-type Fe3+/spermidine/putrescine transport system ATPase subunit
MPAIRVEGLSKSFGRVKVLKEVSFSVGEGEYAVVVGPSGCGKTTLLKTLAGLYSPDAGRVVIGDADVTGLPPEARNIGFFFQHYHLFPHLTVRANVAYGLEARGVAPAEADAVVLEKLRLVGLADWADHMPAELSGGMQQRVALARVLACGSKVLLLDEPLNALDAKIASMLRGELKCMAKALALTVIHVTPNQWEAMEMADRIILIRDGRVVQTGSDVESYTQPRTLFAAYFLGDSNFLRARRVDAHTARYRHVNLTVEDEVADEGVILAIRSEKIRLEEHERNTLDGTVEAVNFLGNTTRYEISQRGRHMHVETAKHPNLKAGDPVRMYLPPEDLMVFPDEESPDDDLEVI